MAFEMRGGRCWMRIILVKGCDIDGVSCKSYTHDMFLLYRNLLKHAVLSVGMCCCMKLEDDCKWGAANDLNIIVIHLTFNVWTFKCLYSPAGRAFLGI
jgi:hypothetical protein